MKPRYLPFLFSLFVLTLVSCAERDTGTSQPKSAQIVLQNPGFEMPGSNHSIPGWNTAQHAGEPSYDMTMDNVIAATGKQSFRMTQTNPQSYGAVEQHVAAPPDLIGKTMRLTAKMKTSKVGPNGWTLFLFVADRTDYVLTTYSSHPVVGTTDWQQLEVTGKVLPKTARFTVGAHLTDTGNGGVAWLDDVELQVIEDGTPAKP